MNAQAPVTIKFRSRHLPLAVRALREHATAHPADRELCQRLLESFPDGAPYTLTLLARNEWIALSRALRPEGSAPKTKSAMQYLSVYRFLMKHYNGPLMLRLDRSAKPTSPPQRKPPA